MKKNGNQALLPAGLQDLLMPAAAHEAEVVRRLIDCFSSEGYDRIKPPLLEFENALLSGAGETLSDQIFRLMDPSSHRMMGVRADITPQIARIAASRLQNAPRPLRLCYGGDVLQVTGSQLRPERQFTQVGGELIGVTEDAADAEVILAAVSALESVGVKDLSVDINLPTLVPAIALELGIDNEAALDLRVALDRKDAAEVEKLAGNNSEFFLKLLNAAGTAEEVLNYASGLNFSGTAKHEFERLVNVVNLVAKAAPDLTVTLDLVEHRGFEYHTGTSFIFFSKGVRGELGRGGRYDSVSVDNVTEPATGFTLFMDTVLRALPKPKVARRIFLPYGTRREEGNALRVQGWVTIAGLELAENDRAEALRLSCSHLLENDHIHELGNN
ncbi:MAG: ATP phosphoribosyltransferase regulatory subunit [Halopseudomonas aestusnigri]